MFCDIIRAHEKKKQAMKDYLSSEKYALLVQSERDKRWGRLNEIFDDHVSLIINRVQARLSELISGAEPEDYPYLNDSIGFSMANGDLCQINYKDGKRWSHWDLPEHEKLSFDHKIFDDWLECVAFSHEKSDSKKIQLRKYMEEGSWYQGSYPEERVLAHLAWRKAEADLENVGIQMKGNHLFFPSGNKINLAFSPRVEINLNGNK